MTYPKQLQYLAGLWVLLTVTLAPIARGEDYERVYDAHTRQYVYMPQKPQKKSWTDKLSGGIKSLWREPILKKSIIGGGVGVGAAAIAEKNMLKGGLVGAGVGAGWAVLDDSKTLDRRPLLKSISKGALAGVGASAVTGGLGAIPGAAIGAGVGAATHYVKK